MDARPVGEAKDAAGLSVLVRKVSKDLGAKVAERLFTGPANLPQDQGLESRLSLAIIRADLDQAWEVLAEAVQTVMRANGIPDGYDRLKDFSRGQPVDRESLHSFIRSLELPAAERERLLALTPAGYLGLAPALARE
jgi:hypothetical protein